MSKMSKLTIGVSLASGALLAAWLLTGSRKEKTKQIINKGKVSFKKTIEKTNRTERTDKTYDDSEIHYV